MSLDGRAADLRAVIGEHTTGEVSDLFAAIMCDSCGAVLTAPSAEALAALTREWDVGAELGGRDTCPACLAR